MSESWIDKYNLISYDFIDSTNIEAIRIAQSSKMDKIVIYAKKQTNGIGRQNRKWDSDEGNLYMSILCSHKFDVRKNNNIPFMIANVIYDTIENLIDNKDEVKIELKWPNDVLLNKKKVAGILCHSINQNDKFYIVIGIGLNIFTTPDILGTTSLANEKINIENIENVLDLIMINFDKVFSKWEIDGDFSEIKFTWMKRAYKINEELIITINNQKIIGIFDGIIEDGSIKLLLADGEIKYITIGDIS